MNTKLRSYCDSFIEAGFLLCIISTAVFFNVYSSRIYEPDKSLLVRSIAVLMALAWLVRRLDSWWHRPRVEEPAPQGGEISRATWRERRGAHAIVILTLFVLLDMAIATLLSVAPSVSLWGSYERLQGLFTTTAYVVIFLSVVKLVRAPEDLERIFSAILLASLPVSLYGIIQHFGGDPLPWMGDVRSRAASTLGNPIFVGAFLVLAIPPALHRVVEANVEVVRGEKRGTAVILIAGNLVTLALQMFAWWIGPRTGTLAAIISMSFWLAESRLMGRPIASFLRLGTSTILLATQLICLFLTQSRGPWLGLLFGIILFVFLRLLAARRLRTALSVAAAGATAAMFLTLLALPTSPLAFLRDVPYLGRLGSVWESSGRVRLLTWEGTTQLITANPLRTVVGHGPETLRLVYPPFYSPELGRLERRDAIPDRAHNEVFDVLASSGIVGLALHILLLTALFYQGLEWAGFLRSRRERRLFLFLWFGGGAAAVLVLCFLNRSWSLLGVSLPLGMLGGLTSYLVIYAVGRLRGQQSQAKPDADPRCQLVVIVLLSAIAAHVVETNFGIAVVSTRVGFWTYAALLVVVGRWMRSEAPRPPPAMNTDTSHPTRAPARFSSTAHAILVAFVLATLIHGFFSPYVSVERWTIVLWLLAFTWVYGGLELLTHVLESDSRPLRRGIASACGIYGGITVGASLLFLTTQELTRALGREPADIALPYPLFTLTTLVALGFTFLRPPQLLAGRRVRGAAVVYCAAAAAALSVANTTHIRPLRADVYHEAASIAWERDGDGERAASLGRRAVALAPRQDVYHHFLAQLAVERAAKAPSEPARDALFEESRRALLEARALSPLLVDHASNLARLHQIWSGQANQEDARAKHLSESLRLYQVAAALGPNRPKTWIDWGLCCQLAGDEEGALEKFQHALRLDATYAETHIFLGAFHASRGDWQAAAGAYEHAVLHEPGSVVAHRNLGDVYRQLGRATAAALQYHRVLELQPNDTTSHHILALMYRAAGHADAALTHARQALTEAPPSERAALTILVEELDAEVD